MQTAQQRREPLQEKPGPSSVSFSSSSLGRPYYQDPIFHQIARQNKTSVESVVRRESPTSDTNSDLKRTAATKTSVRATSPLLERPSQSTIYLLAEQAQAALNFAGKAVTCWLRVLVLIVKYVAEGIAQFAGFVDSRLAKSIDR